jgi:hypothetical protein
MTLPTIVSREQWFAARKELLAKEKELTRHRDQVNAERRRLPMVEITKGLRLRGHQWQGRSPGPVRGPSPTAHLPLHVRPRLGWRL